MAHEMKDNEMSSAAAFVEGGIQDACGDACSICLDEFSQTDPSTLTCCNHEFHLHCILEWCQRSSQCPMCWQSISLKDPTSQELLEAVERERKIRANPPPARRRASGVVFRHSTLGDFRLPVGASDEELERRIIQHLSAVAAIRSNHQRIHSSREGGGQSPLMVFSSGRAAAADPQGLNRRNSGMEEEERGSLDLVRLSESLKSKWSMVSSKYKESIARSTRGWREKLFARNSSMEECAVEGSSRSRRREMNGSSSNSNSLLCCISQSGQQQQQQVGSDGGYSAIRPSRSNHQTSNQENKSLIIGGEQGEAQGYV